MTLHICIHIMLLNFFHALTHMTYCNTNSLINHVNKYSNGHTHDYTTKPNATGIHYHNQAHLPKSWASGGDKTHEEEDDNAPHHLHVHLALQLGPLVSCPSIVQHGLCLTSWWLWEREGGQVFIELKWMKGKIITPYWHCSATPSAVVKSCH